MTATGKYYYARHRRMWGVWKKNDVVNGISLDDFVDDFLTREEARREVYRLNGWEYRQ